MKNAILFVALFTYSCISFGQDVTLFAVEIDSVENLLHAGSKDDTIKVKRLNDLARICFYDLQYKRASLAARQAQQLALKLNYPKGKGMYLRTLSSTYMDTYYDAKARLFYKDLNETEPANTIKDKEADSGFFENGVARLQKDLAFFQSKKDEEMIANTFYALSTTSGYLKKSEAELAYIDKAIMAFKGIKMQDAAAFLLIKKMTVLQRNGKTDQIEAIENETTARINTLNDKRLSAFLTYQICQYYNFNELGKQALIIEKALKANNDLEVNEDKQLQILILESLGLNFAYLSMPNKAVEYYKKATLLRDELNFYDGAIRIYFNLGFEFVALKNFDEANKYFSKAKILAENTGDSIRIAESTFRYLDGTGQILMGQNKYGDALKVFYQANDLYKTFTSQTSVYINFYIAACYQKTGDLKKSIRYGEESYIPAIIDVDKRLLIKICLLLSEVYELSGASTKSYEYLKQYRNLIKEKEEQDIGNRAASFEIQAIIEKNQLVKDRLEKDKLQKEKENQNQRWWLVSIAGALLSTFVVLFILFRNNKQKQKANVLLQRQKQEIDSQKYEVENTLSELKLTQAQLIQSEKMASLGELTAGIAHEIQNPLNFVNNFSEVNQEMIEELQTELKEGNTEEAIAISNDIKDNEEKINLHGKRADAIVKGMLQHSRTSTGQNEATDINALCDEYLRLSYHGLRAKDKSFNADFKTHFDESIGKIDVVPQDIGRVLLNLYNNAFYAVQEQLKKSGGDYKPTVSVSTKKLDDAIKICVQDNGMGISKSLQDKIFQPFFTTKPTGQGTGLGLSLSYDIIKAHGGGIMVESNEGSGALFIVTLPMAERNGTV